MILLGINVLSALMRRAPEAAVIDKMSTEIAKILATPDAKEKLAGEGVVRFISTPDQLAVLIKADMAKYARTIKTANMKFE